MKGFVIKTKTLEGYSAHTAVFVLPNDVIVIDRRFFADADRIEFLNDYIILRKFKGKCLCWSRIFFKKQTFETIVKLLKELNIK